MAGKEKVESMLSPYRVLDLTDEKGLFCGKLLGDLGADVIKVEKPGGDPTRSIGPFYQDEEDPEKSLLWFAFNTSKRGITLDIEVPDGREVFKRLVKTADFVVESFPPGYMGKLGLGYEELKKINPGMIMISITPFGQTGPYKDYNAPDIVLWAMGGRMYSVGDADRPPLRTSYHSQAYLQAGLDASIAAMMALYYRQLTSDGQFVDVSIQAAAAQPGDTTWDILRRIRYRGGLRNPSLQMRRTWPCKDGLVTWIFMPGQMGGRRRNEAFINWMDSEGMADDFLKEFDWDTLDYADITQETIDRLEAPTVKFFMQHTKLELLEGAVKYRILFYPQFDTTDILASDQLASRGYWVELEHPELDATITHPGAFAIFSETPPQVTQRAPLIGEHNQDIYKSELHMSDQEIKRLKQSKVI